MLTRCPHCETAFRVTTEQLKVRHGQVRCGQCRAVFDALDSLVDEPTVVVRAPAAVTENPAPQVEIAADEATATVEEPSVDSLSEMPAEGAAEETRRSPGDAAEDEPASEAPIAVAEAAAPAEPETVPASETPAEPAAQDETDAAAEAPLPPAWEAVASPPPPPRRWPWAMGATLLLLLGFGQLTYLFRSELAVRIPELRPLLAAGCELVGCTLPRPRRPELVGIETSDLAPEGSGLLLTAMLKNRAPFAQDYPALELTLTDTQDQALVRKVLVPADYLPADRQEQAGFAAQGEVAVKLSLAAAGVPAVGYRLYLFYP